MLATRGLVVSYQLTDVFMRSYAVSTLAGGVAGNQNVCPVSTEDDAGPLAKAFREYLAERVKQFGRKAQLARDVGLSRGHIGQLARGTRRARVTTMDRIIVALGGTPNEFYVAHGVSPGKQPVTVSSPQIARNDRQLDVQPPLRSGITGSALLAPDESPGEERGVYQFLGNFDRDAVVDLTRLPKDLQHYLWEKHIEPAYRAWRDGRDPRGRSEDG